MCAQKRRLIAGADDQTFKGVFQFEDVSGADLCNGADDCIQPDGSGYYLVPSKTHSFYRDGRDLDAVFETGDQPWSMGSNLDWLATAARPSGTSLPPPSALPSPPPSASPSLPPSAPPRPAQPPFSPLGSGETIVQMEVTVVTTQLTVAGDVSTIDLPALESNLRVVLQCAAPACMLRVMLSAGSVVVTGELTVATSDSASFGVVSAAANTLVASSPATLGAAIGVTVEAISPTIGVQTHMVAVQVAPPPPSTPPPTPPLKAEMGLGVIIGPAVAAAAVVLMGAVALLLYRRRALSLRVKDATLRSKSNNNIRSTSSHTNVETDIIL